MDGIERYRLEIDRIDSELLQLLNRRAACALAIGEIKKGEGRPIAVPEREKEVVDRMISDNGGPLSPDSVKVIFQQVITQMKILEEGGENK